MQKRTICHITDVHPRYDIRIFEKQCKSLAQCGYNVYLLVCDDKSDEEKEGVHIISTKYQPSSRKARFIKGPKAVLKKALDIDADIYQLHDPELLTIAQKLKKSGKKVIFDSHEDVEKQLYDANYIPRFLRKIVSKAYFIYAGKQIKKIDGVISVSPHIVDKLRKYNENAQLITNYPIVEPMLQFKAPKREKPYVFFAGGISEQWMHEYVVKAISKIQDIEYIIAGSTSDDYMNRLKSLEGWDRVTYLGRIDRQEVAEWYAGCLAGISINYSSQAKGIGTLGNNKLFEIMCSGKPVICTDYPLWRDIVVKHNCGICVEPFDTDKIAEAISFLACNQQEAVSMGKNGRRMVEEQYNWKSQERELLRFYETILGKA